MLARDNPFSSCRMHSVGYAFMDGSDCKQLLRRLHQIGGRGAIVGPEGTGKSTLLEELRACCSAQGYRTYIFSASAAGNPILFREFVARMRAARKADYIFIDSGEQLGRLRLRLVRLMLSSKSYLVITAHRKGLLPTLYRTEVSSKLLTRIVGQLLPAGAELPARAECMLAAHRGNVRGVLRELYDYYAALPPEQLLSGDGRSE